MPKQFTVTLQCISWHLASLYPTDHVYSVDLVCRSLGFVQVLSFQVKFISIFSQETITLWTCRYGSLQCLRHCRTAGDTHMHITSHSSLKVICVKIRFWSSISHVAYMYQLWVSDEMRFCNIYFWQYLMHSEYWNRHLMKSNHIIRVKWSALCLYVTNDSRSLKWHNKG